MQWPRPRRSRADRYESVRVHRGKYLDTLLLLKLTITPFASVGYHGGRWSTLEVRPHYTWPHTHTRTRIRIHTHTRTHICTRTYPHKRTCTRFYRKSSARGKKRRRSRPRVRNARKKRHASFQHRVSGRTDERPHSAAALPPLPFPVAPSPPPNSGGRDPFPVPSFIRRRATSRRCPGVPLALTGASPFVAGATCPTKCSSYSILK